MPQLKHFLTPLSISIVLIWILVTTLTASPITTAATSPLEIPTALREKAQTSGTVRVIVGVEVPTFTLESEQPHRQAVEAQRAAIRSAQDALLRELAPQRPQLYTTYQTIPYMAMRVDAAGLQALADNPRVNYIHEDSLFYTTLGSSTAVIGAPRAWADGYDGAGQTVVIVDTGVDADHPFFEGRVVNEACFSDPAGETNWTSLCPNGETTQTGPGASDPLIPVCLDGQRMLCEHGTHVAGIAAGHSLSLSGIAPKAQIVGIQVFTRIDDFTICFPYYFTFSCVTTSYSDVLRALEYVHDDLTPQYNIASVNMSLGGDQYSNQAACDADFVPLKMAIDQLRAEGIATVIASGNNGWTDSLSGPGCISSAVAVGATTDSDEIASFSNSHPMVDLLAPGASIESSIPDGGYAVFDGTSMATPHVAGAWAVMKELYPNGSVDEILDILSETGKPVADTRPGGNVTRPRIDLGAVFGPRAAVQPQEIDVTISTQLQQTQTLSIANLGLAPLTWSMINIPTTTMLADPSSPLETQETVSLTHSLSQQIVPNNSFACESGGDQRWLRVFPLTDFGITEPFDVSSVDVAIEEAANSLLGFHVIQVNLYTLEGDLATGTLLPIGSADTLITDQTQQIVSVPVTGHAPAESKLVVEIYYPDPSIFAGTILFGSNSAGQTAPTYFKAPACNINAFTDTAALGHANMQLVLNVHGQIDESLRSCNQSIVENWIKINTTHGSVNPGGLFTQPLVIDATNLNQGVYTDTLCLQTNGSQAGVVKIPVTVNVLSCAGLPNCVAPPQASFTLSADNGFAPLTVVFTNTSAGVIDSWLWDFGDGVQSNQANPHHQYTQAGTYTATLHVTNTAATSVFEHVITVYAPVQAEFSAPHPVGAPPLTVTFHNDSSGNFDHCIWDFGDGAQLQSCAAEVTHTYTALGSYNVILAISGEGGADLLQKFSYVIVSNDPLPYHTYIPLVQRE